MSYQYTIDDIKSLKLEEILQNPYITIMYILLLTPMFAYAIFHITIVLRSVILDDFNFRFVKLTCIIIIGIISIYTAIKITFNVAEKSYNMTKYLYTMLGYNSMSLFDNIFYIIFFGLYIVLFLLVMIMPVDISLLATIVYILCYCFE
jgi:hypothetical protein